MFIQKIVSYGNAWERLQTDFPEATDELKSAIAALTIHNIASADLTGMEPRFSRDNREDNGLTFGRFRAFLWKSLCGFGWSDSRIYKLRSNRRVSSLGMLREGQVSLNMFLMPDSINRWMYTASPLAIIDGTIEIPIAIYIVDGNEDLTLKGMPVRNGFAHDMIVRDLQELSPLSHKFPFLIIGIGLSDVALPEILEISSANSIESNVIISRELEFPPEYQQAGIGILSYFGEVLRENYPDRKAKVKIEQDGLLVRLIIESADGNRQIIEKALRDYELVVRGEASPDIIFDNKAKVVELKCELRMAQARIESQAEIIQLQRDQMLTLREIIGSSLTQHLPSAINVNVSPMIAVSSSSKILLSGIVPDLTELIDLLASKAEIAPSFQRRLYDIGEAVEELDVAGDEDTVKKSSALRKLKSFLDDAGAAGSVTNELLKKINDGVDVVQKLASKYNQLASWCGAPQVPAFLLGKNA